MKLRLRRFFGISLGSRRLTLTLPVPGPFLTRLITFFTRKAPPKPYFELLYLDDELRVHETGQGNIFIQELRSFQPPFLPKRLRSVSPKRARTDAPIRRIMNAT